MTADSTDRPRRLLFLIPEDWYVCSHRLPLIRAAVVQGWRVTVVTRVRLDAAPIAAAGARVIPLELRRGFRNPLSDLWGLLQLIRIYRRERPDLVHQVTPKSVLFGSLAAAAAGVPRVINALAGMGYLYTDGSLPARIARPAVTLAMRTLLKRGGTWVIVQNQEDRDFFVGTLRLPPAQVVLIPGSGVDTTVFSPAAQEPPPPLRAVLPARMIAEKGVREFVAAARQVRGRRRDIEFLLAGDTDPEHPSRIDAHVLRGWHAEGVVRWLGKVDDMPALLRSCHLAVLPTYREGFPKALLEAAACGLPLIAADVAGCRAVCRDGHNGLLVAPRDPLALAEAVVALADDPDRRRRLGEASRALVAGSFAEEAIIGRTLDLYRAALAAKEDHA